MKFNKKIIIGLLIIVLIIAVSYTVEFSYKSFGLKSGAVIQISYNNQVAAYFGGDVLKKLPDGTAENSNQGPTLNSVLIAAGISDFKKVEISGLEDDVPYKLDGKQISDNYRFYYTDHNTVSLAQKSDSGKILVEDVSKINAAD